MPACSYASRRVPREKVSVEDFRALCVLSQQKLPVTQAKLAELLGKKRSTARQHMDSLIRSGYLVKSSEQAWAKCTVTEEGKRLIRRVERRKRNTSVAHKQIQEAA